MLLGTTLEGSDVTLAGGDVTDDAGAGTERADLRATDEPHSGLFRTRDNTLHR